MQCWLALDTAAPPRARGRTHIVTITETWTLGSWWAHTTDPIASAPSRERIFLILKHFIVDLQAAFCGHFCLGLTISSRPPSGLNSSSRFQSNSRFKFDLHAIDNGDESGQEENGEVLHFLNWTFCYNECFWWWDWMCSGWSSKFLDFYTQTWILIFAFQMNRDNYSDFWLTLLLWKPG